MHGIFKKLNLNQEYNKVPDLKQVADTPFFYGALNLVYGVVGHGKSWQTVKLISNAGNKVVKVLLDCDGSNGGKFVRYCGDNDVEYVNAHINLFSIDEWEKTSMIEKIISTVSKTIDFKTEDLPKDKYTVIVLDSLSAIGEGLQINNSENIAPVLYELNNLVKNKNVALVLIDHATQIRDKGKVIGIKIEGNESGKLRATASAVEYKPLDENKPQDGGSFIVKRSRDSDLIKVGRTFDVHNRDEFKMAKEFIMKKMQDKKEITQSEFTAMTKHKKDQWVRGYKDKLFNSEERDKTTYLTLKKDT